MIEDRNSKGAFYHYFSSKDALLEALVEQMAQGAEAQLLVVVRDASLNALEKLRRYFQQSLKWKSAEKPLLLQLLRVWSSDENAVLRQKLSAETRSRTARLLEPILRQGVNEKLFNVAHPEHVAVFVAGLGLSMTDQLLAAMFAPAAQEQASRQLDTLLDYAHAQAASALRHAGDLHVSDRSFARRAESGQKRCVERSARATAAGSVDSVAGPAALFLLSHCVPIAQPARTEDRTSHAGRSSKSAHGAGVSPLVAATGSVRVANVSA